jgi:heptosyltransferase I
MKWIFVRVDKIGDLVCTLPVDQIEALKTKKAQITWLVNQTLTDLMEITAPKRQFFTTDTAASWKNFWNLVKQIRNQKPRGVLFFYCPWWVSLAFLIAGVRYRVGRRSQWHSYLFLNKSLRQSRSKSDKHEYQYNHELLEFAFRLDKSQPQYLKLQPTDKSELLNLYHLKPKKYFVVHPGMAGSARNWDQDHYCELISKLIETQVVVITGTTSDEPYLDKIKAQWMGHQQVRWLQDKLRFSDLVYILSQATSVIAPSTGVAHLAAGVGTPLISIYSPMKVHASTRWAPRGKLITILEPTVPCPASTKCWEKQCTHFDCMNAIKINQVIRNLPATT